MTGFVYVLGNNSMPGLIKVGMTNRSPYARLKELSASTSVPQQFELLAYFMCDDAARHERYVHDYLADERVSDRREFFRTCLHNVYWGVEGCDGIVTNAGMHRFADEMIEWINAGKPAEETLWHFADLLARGDWNYVSAWVSRKTGRDFEDYLRSFLNREAA